VHDPPEPTEEEHEQAATARQREEEAKRYPSHDDPKRVVDPAEVADDEDE